MQIITGYRGEPHITAEQERAKYSGIIGRNAVLYVYDNLSASVISANSIRLSSGMVCFGPGCTAYIPYGTTETVTIANGAQGKNRIDLIVARYDKDSGTGVESVTLTVIQGTATTGTPTEPTAYTGNAIYTGYTPVDCVLYKVRLTGLNTPVLTRVTPVIRNYNDLNDLVGSTSISSISDTLTGGLVAVNNKIGNYISSGVLVSSDLDSIAIDPGNYILSGSNTYQHIPSGVTYGLLEYIRPNPSSLQFAVQRIYYGTANLYQRFYVSGSWTSWYKWTGSEV